VIGVNDIRVGVDVGNFDGSGDTVVNMLELDLGVTDSVEVAVDSVTSLQL
jgi:hypothetical protein